MMFRLPRPFLTLALLVVATLVGGSSLFAETRQNPTLVVFTANWCASCRKVVPLVQDVGVKRGVTVEVLDVDDSATPTRVTSFGLAMPRSKPPMVYVVQGGQTTLVLDGKSYSYGQEDAIRSAIEQKL